MYTIISILIIIASILLAITVLAQNSKGGGLASNLAGSNQVMGVRKTADFIEKLTWGLAISLLILSFLAVAFSPRANVAAAKSEIEAKAKEVATPNQAPSFPAAPQKEKAQEVPAQPQPAEKK
jgi:preprotein translocase subunit SecG